MGTATVNFSLKLVKSSLATFSSPVESSDYPVPGIGEVRCQEIFFLNSASQRLNMYISRVFQIVKDLMVDLIHIDYAGIYNCNLKPTLEIKKREFKGFK